MSEHAPEIPDCIVASLGVVWLTQCGLFKVKNDVRSSGRQVAELFEPRQVCLNNVGSRPTFRIG